MGFEAKFGYGREVYFWTFLSALVTFTITAGASFYFGFNRLINPQPIENVGIAFITMGIALTTNGYSMSLSLKRLLAKSVEIWALLSKETQLNTQRVMAR